MATVWEVLWGVQVVGFWPRSVVVLSHTASKEKDEIIHNVWTNVSEEESFCEGYCSLLACLGRQARVHDDSNLKSDHLVSLLQCDSQSWLPGSVMNIKEAVQQQVCNSSANSFSCKVFMTHASRTLLALFNPFPLRVLRFTRCRVLSL